MALEDEKIKNLVPRRKSPFIVSVNKDETDNFMNDIIKGASKLNTKQKRGGKSLFFKSFLVGFILFCVGSFFFYTSYYFVDHAILHRQESCFPLTQK